MQLDALDDVVGVDCDGDERGESLDLLLSCLGRHGELARGNGEILLQHLRRYHRIPVRQRAEDERLCLCSLRPGIGIVGGDQDVCDPSYPSPRTPEEAEELPDDSPSAPAAPSETVGAALRDLARRRFAHLQTS